MNFYSGPKTLEYYSENQKLGFLIFFTKDYEPDIIKVLGLIKKVGNDGEKETFDDAKIAYGKMLEELSTWISLHALAERNTRLIFNLNGSPIRLNAYDSILAEKLTEETENILKKYLHD